MTDKADKTAAKTIQAIKNTNRDDFADLPESFSCQNILEGLQSFFKSNYWTNIPSSSAKLSIKEIPASYKQWDKMTENQAQRMNKSLTDPMKFSLIAKSML